MKNNIIVRSYNLKKQGLSGKGKFSLVFLTDLHIEKETPQLKKIEKMMENLCPDIVLVGGDVIIGKAGKSTQYAVEFMNRISQKYMVIYANGNHEQRITEYEDVYGTMGTEYDSFIKKMPLVRLINQKLELVLNGVPIVIYGHQPDLRFYEKKKRPQGMKEDLIERFQWPDGGKYTILLSHNPRFQKEYFSWGADLTLSGHYHGGVMLLTDKCGVITPDFRLFSSLCCGMHERYDKKMIISAGIGEHTIPVRVHNPKEITYISVECS